MGSNSVIFIFAAIFNRDNSCHEKYFSGSKFFCLGLEFFLDVVIIQGSKQKSEKKIRAQLFKAWLA